MEVFFSQTLVPRRLKQLAHAVEESHEELQQVRVRCDMHYRKKQL